MIINNLYIGIIENFNLFGVLSSNMSTFYELLFRFVLNFFIVFFVVHFIYAKNSKRKDFYFSFISIATIIFLLSFLLNSIKIELGFAMGIFAIFGIIRYRTDAIPIKEMTYLFIVIGISVLNALISKKMSYAQFLFVNIAIVGVLWLLEKRLMLKQEASISLIYEKIENIHSNKSEALLDDLKKRTGIDIIRYEIVSIDFMKDAAKIILYYYVNGKHE